MDMSGFQEGAAYEEIQAWVREKYGFYATHLNIAKTKQKGGISERQNYNLPKSEDTRSPETLKEKTWGRSFCICPRVSFLTFETKGQKRKARPCVSTCVPTCVSWRLLCLWRQGSLMPVSFVLLSWL